MQLHQQRVVDEKSDLDAKISSLGPFLYSETFKSLHFTEQERLIKQHSIMEQYSDVLGQRIAAFT